MTSVFKVPRNCLNAPGNGNPQSGSSAINPSMDRRNHSNLKKFHSTENPPQLTTSQFRSKWTSTQVRSGCINVAPKCKNMKVPQFRGCEYEPTKLPLNVSTQTEITQASSSNQMISGTEKEIASKSKSLIEDVTALLVSMVENFETVMSYKNEPHLCDDSFSDVLTHNTEKILHTLVHYKQHEMLKKWTHGKKALEILISILSTTPPDKMNTYISRKRKEITYQILMDHLKNLYSEFEKDGRKKYMTLFKGAIKKWCNEQGVRYETDSEIIQCHSGLDTYVECCLKGIDTIEAFLKLQNKRAQRQD